MSARQRILALKLLERQKRNPEFAKKIGLEIQMMKNTTNSKEKRDKR